MKLKGVIIGILISLTSFAQEKKDIAITHLTGDCFVYTTYNTYKETKFPSNSMYIVTRDGIVMIDTPWDTTQFQPLLDSIHARHNKPVVLCISTHFHADRTAGLEFLREKGIKTYTSKQTYDLCTTHGEKQSEFYFTKDTVFRVGGQIIQTYYPGEGHAPDNIVIWYGKNKVLYGGCFVKSTDNTDLGNLSDANLKQWPASINRTMKKFPKPAFVIPGHFSWENNKSLQHTLNLLKTNRSKKPG
jgi:metallo-beta-lactamase class B